MRVVVAAATLVSLMAIVPLRLPAKNGRTSSKECLTIADASPGAGTIADLERCAAAGTDDLELLAALGTAYESAGRANDAEHTYGRVLSLDDEYADVHVRLARLLIGRGDRDAARRHLDRALQLQPNRAAIRSLLADLSQPRP